MTGSSAGGRTRSKERAACRLISTEQKARVFVGSRRGPTPTCGSPGKEFLIRMVANAFGLPPSAAGAPEARRQPARLPRRWRTTKRFAAPSLPLAQCCWPGGIITRDLFAKCIGWREFEFVFNESERAGRGDRAGGAGAAAAGWRVLTVDEVRAMRGLAPLWTERRWRSSQEEPRSERYRQT